jgi:broad specificity phosphatase PhoE
MLLLSAFSCAPKNETITILVVRHAEKAVNQGDDPHLSEAGLARAQALARVAENAHAGAVYVSQFQRTKETAAPLLAKHSDVKLNTLPVNLSKTADYPQVLAKTILSHERGNVVLVVSHSNLVPGIVEALTRIKVPPMGDDEFSRLYIVTVRPGMAPQLISAQYGCP